MDLIPHLNAIGELQTALDVALAAVPSSRTELEALTEKSSRALDAFAGLLATYRATADPEAPPYLKDWSAGLVAHAKLLETTLTACRVIRNEVARD